MIINTHDQVKLVNVWIEFVYVVTLTRHIQLTAVSIIDYINIFDLGFFTFDYNIELYWSFEHFYRSLTHEPGVDEDAYVVLVSSLLVLRLI